MFSKVLVANRGEIAVRVIRALDELGIASVAVYSEADRDAQHVKRATRPTCSGPGRPPSATSRSTSCSRSSRQSGAEAVHPGYGFLAENAAFASALEEAGITFIGPPASAIEAMGSKTRARELMQAAGVPIVPGTTERGRDAQGRRRRSPRRSATRSRSRPPAAAAARASASRSSPTSSQDAFEGAAREGEKFFSDPTVYLERYLPDPRHVEVQVLADQARQHRSTSASATARSSAATRS